MTSALSLAPTQRKERIGYELSFDLHTCAKTGALALPQEIECKKSLKTKLSTTKLTEKNSSNPNKTSTNKQSNPLFVGPLEDTVL